MFSVIFEVQPAARAVGTPISAQGQAASGRQLEQIDGFVDNIRYRSLTRDGMDPVALGLARREGPCALAHPGRGITGRAGARPLAGVARLPPPRGRGDARHAPAPDGQALRAQRLDETVVLPRRRNGRHPDRCHLRGAAGGDGSRRSSIARRLGLAPQASGLLAWDCLRRGADAGRPAASALLGRTPARPRPTSGAASRSGRSRSAVRRVRVVRDYGMFDRREAPQYFPEATATQPAAPR